MEIKPGSVVFAEVHLGDQSKIRPGIVVDSEDGRIRLILGSTKKTTSREEQFVIISNQDDKRAMGIQETTGFEVHHRTVVWVGEKMVTKVVGFIPKSVEKRIGAALMYARMNRMI